MSGVAGLRVGFLGVAHVHAAGYAGLLRGVDLGARPTAVFDPDPARATAFGGTFGLRVARDPEELCRTVDAVIVTAEHARLAPFTRVAVAHGRPVLCEKPLGASLADAAEVAGLGGWVSVAFPVRYAPSVRSATVRYQSGDLGRLVAAVGVNRGAFPGGFFGRRALSGGGAIVDHVVHLADALQLITGCRYDTVYAEAGRLRGVGDVEDAAAVIATTTDGAWVSIDPSWSHPAGMAGANDCALDIWCEAARLEVDAFARHAELVDDTGRLHHLGYGPSIDQLMLADLVAALRADRPPPVPAEAGLRAAELAFGAAEAAETGVVVRIGGS